MRCRSADNLNATTRTRMRRANRIVGPITQVSPATGSVRFGGSGRLGCRADRCRAARRPGVVLIMVVAVLGILFVSGVALLTMVTFSSRSLDAAKAERENRDAVDAIERLVAMKLAEGFLNVEVTDPGFPNGIPLSMSTPRVMHPPGMPTAACTGTSDCVLAMPTQGEVPGIHLVDVTEPIEVVDSAGNSTCEFRLTSNFKAAMTNTPLRQPALGANDTTLTIRVNAPETGAIGSGVIYNPQGQPEYYNDADGDGVLDAVEMTLPANLLPPDLRRSLANRLRADISAPDPDELTITLRVIDHGALVDLNNSHPYMKRMALGYSYRFDAPFQPVEPTNAELFAGAPYQPESNEWMLRNRGMLTPLSVQPTRLMATLGSELLCSESMGGFQNKLCSPTTVLDELANPAARHWWGYDPVADTADIDSPWRARMNPANLGNPNSASPSARQYDVGHNLTTVNHDDLFMRSYVSGGVDVLSSIANDAMNGGVLNTYDAYPGAHALDQYPLFLDGVDDPRRGRLKISFPHLDDIRRQALANGGPSVLPKDKERVIRLIQDAFLVMLGQRPDFNQDGSVDDVDTRGIVVQAAMLTANVVDYADFDPSPTPVVVVDLAGNEIAGPDSQSKRLVAYGFERQPFITEVVSSTTAVLAGSPARIVAEESSAVFAIELYNPYSTDIDLSDYELSDLNPTDDTNVISQIDLQPVKRIRSEQLSGTIPGDVTIALDHPSRFVTFCGYGQFCPNDANNAGGTNLTEFAFDQDSRIALVRRDVTDPDGNTVKIVVDRFDAMGLTVTPNGAPAPGAANPSGEPDLGEVPTNPGAKLEVALQRDTLLNFWRFTVPRSVKVWGPDEAQLGRKNSNGSYTKSVQDNIYPVHLDVFDGVANKPMFSENDHYFTWAFPTTGSLLMVGRMAHIYEVVGDGAGGEESGALTSPFNRTDTDLLGWAPAPPVEPQPRERNIAGMFDQIDNGRLPVFDVRPDVAPARERTLPKDQFGQPEIVPGRIEGLDTLPWGQLVFDYFTAVPFEFDRAASLGNPYYLMSLPPHEREFPPTVDQGGMRVHGRVNINTASWRVLSSLPMLPSTLFPVAYEPQLTQVLGLNRPTLDENLARAIVAYREARDKWVGTIAPDVGEYERDRSPYADQLSRDGRYRPRLGYGFLTVGELLNVRDPNAGVYSASQPADVFRFDADATTAPLDSVLSGSTYPAASFEQAVANIVALDEWVTTRSHVFTIYGVIRGAHEPLPDPSDAEYDRKLSSFQRANQRAIRFQSTVDRLPMVFGAKRPVRIGSRISGGYADVRSD